MPRGSCGGLVDVLAWVSGGWAGNSGVVGYGYGQFAGEMLKRWGSGVPASGVVCVDCCVIVLCGVCGGGSCGLC
mgnify:CR=1 FL=1